MAERSRAVLVTGAASGIGRGIAARFLADGAAVMIADIDGEAARETAAALGEGAEAVAVDVRSAADWDRAVGRCVEAFGGLDVLVNNAAISISGSIEDCTEQGWRDTLDVNCTAVFLGCQRAVGVMRERGGAIVNIASARGRRPSAAQLAYSCSKGLVIHLTEAVALHCAENGLPVRCNAICPGVIDTPILAPFYEALGGREAALRHFASFNANGRLGTIEEIASAVAYLASDEASFITGATLDVDGGFRIRDK